MKGFSYNQLDRNNVKRGGAFELLPKDGYVVKLLDAREEQNKSGNGSHIKFRFDIAEGEYKDFYKKQYDGLSGDNKRWPTDAVYSLSVPHDNAPDWMFTQWNTFWTDVEDSNPGFTFENGSIDDIKGKIVGGLFHNEQSEANGNVYDHTRMRWTTVVANIRNKKFRLPKDKLVTTAPSRATAGTFAEIPMGADNDDIPF